MELFKDRQWIGEFYVPDQYDKRFPGKIDYSPEEGVILSYAITGNDTPRESEVVYGILDTGDKCTLVGKFKPQQTGFALRNGLSTRPGKVGFYCLLIGEFIKPDEVFWEVNFSLTNMQEFFFPQGHKDWEKFSEKPVFSIKTSYGQIEVGSSASFGSLHDDITAQIYSRDTDALERLNQCFKTVKDEYPESSFMLKKDISYRIHIKLDNGLPMRELYDRVKEIADLFALLICNPVYPDSMSIVKRDDGNRPAAIVIYPSLVLDKRTIKLSTMEHSHFQMPITKAKIDLGAIVSAWLDVHKDHSTIISSIQHETGFRDEHSLHGEIVLYATQLESISHTAHAGGKRKYEYPLVHFGCEKITKCLASIFSSSDLAEIGQCIGDLRNEIAHVGRPKKLLLNLPMRDLVCISQCLQMTIIGHMLDSIGISKSIIVNYQQHFCPER